MGRIIIEITRYRVEEPMLVPRAPPSLYTKDSMKNCPITDTESLSINDFTAHILVTWSIMTTARIIITGQRSLFNLFTSRFLYLFG